MTTLKIIILVLVSCFAIHTQAETRQQLAEISKRITKKGNFEYWTKNSQPIQILKDYVKDVTNPKSKNYIKPEERIVVFDMDGTLICETAPTYFEWMLFLYRVFDDPTYTPTQEVLEYATQFKEAAFARKLTGKNTEKQEYCQCESFKGMTLSNFKLYQEKFMETPVYGMNNLKWGEAFFIPMIEIMSYLSANNFITYIVSGAERITVRNCVEGIFAVQKNHIIGSDYYITATKQGTTNSKNYHFLPTDDLHREQLYAKCLRMTKVSNIAREIGMQPVLAFGNATSDYSMFYYTTTNNPKKNLAFCLLDDDVVRERGNPTHAKKKETDCQKNGWVTISMKNDFKTIYGEKITVVK